MTEIDFFGHWGYFFLAAGLYYVGCREKIGWLFRFFGEAIWVVLGVWLGLTSIWMWGLGFMAIDYYNYKKWCDEEFKRAWLADATEWLQASFGAQEAIDKELAIEDKQCESQRADVAKKRVRSNKKKVSTTRRRRSKSTDGQSGSRHNAKPSGTKRGRRNVRVQKNNRRTNTKGSRASKV